MPKYGLPDRQERIAGPIAGETKPARRAALRRRQLHTPARTAKTARIQLVPTLPLTTLVLPETTDSPGNAPAGRIAPGSAGTLSPTKPALVGVLEPSAPRGRKAEPRAPTPAGGRAPRAPAPPGEAPASTRGAGGATAKPSSTGSDQWRDKSSGNRSGRSVRKRSLPDSVR